MRLDDRPDVAMDFARKLELKVRGFDWMGGRDVGHLDVPDAVVLDGLDRGVDLDVVRDVVVPDVVVRDAAGQDVVVPDVVG